MIVTPSLLPDEWAMGYWGRVLLLNGMGEHTPMRDKQAFAIRFCDERRILLRRFDHNLVVVSLAAQVRWEQLIQAHTLAPLEGAVPEASTRDWFDHRAEARSVRERTFQASLRCGALCPKCAEEDLAFWGFSYWRRSHQIPGMVWCQKHLSHLRHAVGPMMSQTPPHQAKLRPLDADDAALSATDPGSAVIFRYTEICSELLQRSKPISRLKMLHSLSDRARALGLQPDGSSLGLSLYDYAADRLPPTWLSRHVRRDVFNDVVRRFRGAPSGVVYSLALAVLYESTDEALLDLARPLPPDESLAGGILKVLYQCLPSNTRVTADEVLDIGVRLYSAIEGILGGETLTEAHKRTRCSEQIIESTLVECFAGACTGQVASKSVLPV